MLRCEYEDRFIAKGAGLRWHPGDRCGQRDCIACRAEIGRVWWTHDVLKALGLVEYAEEVLGRSITERARPVAVERKKAERRAAKEAKARLLTRARTLRASRASDAEISVPSPEDCVYLPYQRAAISFGLDRPNVLFADEMGLGKTIEAIGVINADPGAQRVLVVCPASLKLNWARECERWLVDRGPVGIAGRTYPDDANVVIVNYDILGKWKKQLDQDWDVLVADECHYVKNKAAKRAKALFALRARRKLFLSGTPILNRPVELWGIINYLAPDDFKDFWTFARRHCKPTKNRFGWEFNGATNLDELHESLRSTIMVRRTKAEVLPDLPPKRRQVIEFSSDHLADLIAVETGAWQKHQSTLSELRALRNADDDENPGKVAALRAGVNAAFGELSKLRRETALAKVPLVVDHLKSVLEDAGKIVVFAHHRSVIEGLAEPFSHGAVTLMGADGVAARQAAVDRFQSDPTCRLFVGSITAAGFGLTLTASAHVVFAELDWVPARLTQAEDRTHRIGQRESVLVQHLVLQDSLDARMVGTLIKKQRVIDAVTDGSTQADLFDASFAEELMGAAIDEEPMHDGPDD